MTKIKILHLLLSLTLAIPVVLSAQNAPIDFEIGGYGADWTWTVFENETNPPVEIIANPDVTDPNTSATVAKFTALQAGQPWAGCETLHGSDIGTFNLDDTNCTIKIMVHKPVMSDVGIKLVKPDGWSMGEIKVANTVINEWEEITFDFTAQMTDGYDQIVIFPDFDLNGRTQDNICYFDNITFGNDSSDSEDYSLEFVNSPYILGNNYPNPFNPQTTISYSLQQSGFVVLSIFDVKGRLVETLVNENRPQATHQVIWNAENTASGMYFYRLNVDGKEIDSKRMILLK